MYGIPEFRLPNDIVKYDIDTGFGTDLVFGTHTQDLAVSSTKSMTGHLLGAAGAIEALICIRALGTGILRPMISLDAPDPECELDHVANKARDRSIRVALSNSFGFGGTNAALVFVR
jgi:3-oxoacyl-(acyl-carrier-protein) synthase